MSKTQKLRLARNAEDDDVSLSSMSSVSEGHSKTRDGAAPKAMATEPSDRSEHASTAPAVTPTSTMPSSNASGFSARQRQINSKSSLHSSTAMPQQQQSLNSSVASSALMSRATAPSRSSREDPSLSTMALASTLTMGGMNGTGTIPRLGDFRGTMPAMPTNVSSTISSSVSTQPVNASMLAGNRRSLGPSTTHIRTRQPQHLGSLEITRQSVGSQGGISADPSEQGSRNSLLFNQGGKSSSSTLHSYSHQHSGGVTPFRGPTPISSVLRNSGPDARRRGVNDSNSRLGSLTRNTEGSIYHHRAGSQNGLHDAESSTNASLTRTLGLGEIGVTRQSVESITLSAHSRDASSTIGADSQRFYGVNQSINDGSQPRKSSNTRRARYRQNRGVGGKASPIGSSSEGLNDSSRLRNRHDSVDDEDDEGFRGDRDSLEGSLEDDEDSYQYDDEHGTEESPTEDDPDGFMAELFNRRGNTGPLGDKTTVLENATVWYPNGGQAEDDRPRELGPYGLIIRQIRNGQMEKWQDLESLPVENKAILDDEDVAFELERVRLAAQNDMQGILDVASDLWEKTFQKANDLDRLQAENDELELQLRQYETNIKGLEDKISANAQLWQNKFKSALDELDETEQKLLASKQTQRIRHNDSESDDEPLTGENMYEAYIENLQFIQTLKGEKADLKRSLAEATAQITVLTNNLQELESVNGKYQSLQTKYSQVANQLAQTEKMSNMRLDVIEELEERNLSLQELLSERQKDLDELTQHLNDQRGQHLDDDDLGQTMGVCLLKELLNHQPSDSQLQQQEPLPPIAEDPEPRELTCVSVSPVVIINQKEEREEEAKPELTSHKGRPVELSPTPTEMTLDPNEKGRVEIPPKIKEVVNAVTETVGEIQRVDVQQIGNQIHIHLHQHAHDHQHNHLHNHDHYHSYARTTGIQAAVAASAGSSLVTDDKTATSPLPLTKSIDEEQQSSSPPKKPVIWSRVRLGQQKSEESKNNDSSGKADLKNEASVGRRTRLQVVGGTKLHPSGFVSERQTVKSIDGKIPVFVNTTTNQLEDTSRPIELIDENKSATCSTYGTTKVKARMTESSNVETNNNRNEEQESSIPGQSENTPQNFATLFMEQMQKVESTSKQPEQQSETVATALTVEQ